MTPYETLGVAPDATAAQIKAAYREAVKAHHPDAGGDPAQFIRVQRAHLILSDPERRARYDRTGVEDEASAADDQEAYAALATLVMQAVDAGSDLRRTDVLAGVRDALKREEKAHLAARKALEARIDRFKLMQGRLQYDQGGDDVLSTLLAEQGAGLDAARTQENDRVRIVARALEILTTYSYRLDTTSSEEAAIWSALKSRA